MTPAEAMQAQHLLVEAQNLVAHARAAGMTVLIMQGFHGPIIRIKKATELTEATPVILSSTPKENKDV